jgi:hypothetical protein
MKKKLSLLSVLLLSASWAFATQETPKADEGGLVRNLSSKLGVTEKQAEGGAAAVLSLAKHRMGDGEFGKLSDSHAEIGSILKAAGNLNVTSMVDLAKQFKNLGIDAGLVQKFIPAISDYFGSKGGAGSGLLKSVLSRKEEG